MSKAEFETFVESQINLASQSIVGKKSARLDDVAFGKLGFYLAMRRAMNGTASPQDLGLLDAIDDSLQALRLLDGDETFLGMIKR
jgi:hypothetical protein